MDKKSRKDAPLVLTILMPCLNEAETLATCIKKAKTYLRESRLSGEILIADNGSTDGSKKIALKEGARVIDVREKGYGNALIKGIEGAKGNYIIMGDADDSYDFTNLESFLEKLEEGYELVMGNRFKGGIRKGAMPPLHRYLGNPVLSGIGKLFFRSPINDFHSGLRGFRRDSILSLDLQTTGMEYASEMVVKATLNKLKITEVPIVLYPDGRSRPPHLRSWRDGWRHLRFLLLYSPKWLFFYPGLFFMLIGFISMSLLAMGPVNIRGLNFEVNTMMYAGISILLGFTITSLGIFTTIFSVKNNLLPEPSKFKRIINGESVDYGIIVGGVIFLLGLTGSLLSLYGWSLNGFGDLEGSSTMRIVIPSSVFMVLGIQTIFTTFFISVLGLQTKRNK